MPWDDAQFHRLMDRKYDILAEEAAAKTKQASGEYQRNVADALSLPGYRDALSFHARGAGQLNLEQAATTAADRYATPFERGFVYDNDPRIQRSPGGPAGTGAPATGGHPPIQFQTLPGQPEQPGQPARPVVSPVSTDASLLTSPTSIADMSPEELAQWTKGAATPQGVQGPTAATGPTAQRKLADAQARQPSLLRPTTVTTSKVPAVSPLYSTGFRRGTANVKRQGLKKGTTDVKPDEDTLGALPRPMLGAAPAPSAAVPGAAVPGAGPGAGPGTTTNLPPVGLPSPPPGSPNSAPTGGPNLQPGPFSGPPITGPAGPQPGQPVGPGYGTPYDPKATTGIENMGGVVDATLRMVNPEKFNEALKSFRPSENIEDRRGETYTPGPMIGGKGGIELPTSLSGVPGFLSDLGGRVAEGGRQLSSDIGEVLFGNRAPAGSLADQAGFNQIPGVTAGGILSGFHNPFSSGESAGHQPLAGPAGSSSIASPPPASSMLAGSASAPAQSASAPAQSASAPAQSASAPAPAPSSESSSSASSSAPAPSPENLRKGTANVKGKGNGKGKGKANGGPPKGLEAMLPSLLAAMQGGGAPGPAGPPAGPPAGQPPAPGFKKGSANVKGRGSKGTSGDQPPAGLEALLAAMQQGGGAGGPQAAGSPMPMAPGSAAPPGFAGGIGDVQFTPPPVPPLMSMGLPPTDNRYARGTPSVDQHPGYPFGAGYLFGATAVPGEGTGTVDKVPAMLAPHEAVLNRAAADMLGRGLIAALNSRGVQQMGMGRGAAT